jgi:hypothetical protein
MERPAVDTGTNTPAPAAPAPADERITRRLEELPKEVGVMLVTVGALGYVLPGMAGAPALLAGGLALWPRRFRPVESWFERRFPGAHRASMQQIGRFLDDLERRYPAR